ncbi:MAG: hypothetical protein HY670_12040 [Chloroflexi bacterium]|nr:hypothetical protein [Chloroflexota bacterium]
MSQTLQALVKKIFGDEKTKQQFLADPDSVLRQFTLTEPEKRAVLSTHARLGLATSGPQLEASLKAADPWWAPEP